MTHPTDRVVITCRSHDRCLTTLLEDLYNVQTLLCSILTICTRARSSMDRALDYGSRGWGFDSLRAHHSSRHRPLRRSAIRDPLDIPAPHLYLSLPFVANGPSSHSHPEAIIVIWKSKKGGEDLTGEAAKIGERPSADAERDDALPEE